MRLDEANLTSVLSGLLNGAWWGVKTAAKLSKSAYNWSKERGGYVKYRVSRKGKITQILATLIANQYSNPYRKFVYDYIIGVGRNVDILQLLVDYQTKRDAKSFDSVFDILGVPMLNFFVNSAFGVKSQLFNMIPIVDKIGTGDARVDAAIKYAIVNLLSSNSLRKDMQITLKSEFDNVIATISNNDQFKKLLQTEAFMDIFKRVKVASKPELVKTIMDAFPKLNQKIRNATVQNLMQYDLDELIGVTKGNTIPLVNAMIDSLLAHVYNYSVKAILKDGHFAMFRVLLKRLFQSPKAKQLMLDSLAKVFASFKTTTKTTEKENAPKQPTKTTEKPKTTSKQKAEGNTKKPRVKKEVKSDFQKWKEKQLTQMKNFFRQNPKTRRKR